MTSRKLHKISGLTAGIVIVILSISGLFLNHDNWKFLHNITFETVPSHLYKLNNKTFNSYWINPNNEKHIITGGMRGVFESTNKGVLFHKSLDEIVYRITDDTKSIYVATANGIYKKEFATVNWEKYALDNKIITSLNIYKNRLIAVEDKKNIIVIDLDTNKQLAIHHSNIPSDLLTQNITLSRFVRDLHYGRGLFDGDFSLLINDYASVVLILLVLTGFILWYLIKNIKNNDSAKKAIKYFVKIHANIFSLLAIIPILILLLTGILLDHAKDLNKFMKGVKIQNDYLPPVYRSLQSDIWGADFDGENFYIGNRYGVFQTKDFDNYKFVSKGFAYKMIRKEDILYISGMGSSNRILQNDKWTVLVGAPHMFKDIISKNREIEYFSSHSSDIQIPTFNSISLYSLLYSLHDGSFFASWWIWINDIASVLLLLLIITGSIRWYLRSGLRKRIN